ncbi:NAD-dependent epimerase/dehydratase family protein [soil metagenome]
MITGVTGFIGGEIAAKLVAEKFDVIGLSRNAAKVRSEFTILNADITNREEVLSLAKEGSFDAVIHCAGLAHQFGEIGKERFENVNIKGTENIADLAVKANAGHFIYLSSTAVYGLQNNPMNEETECNPENFYAESKLEAENVCRKICEKNKIPLTILRLVPVVGKNSVGNVKRLIEAIHKRRFLWVGNGENKKTMIYVGDVAEACSMLLKKKKNGTEIYNLASPPIKMRTLVSIISDQLKKKVPGFSIPAFLPAMFFGINSKTFNLKTIERMSQTFEKWLSEDVYPTDKIKTAYGFVAETPIEQAVKQQCEVVIKSRGN